MVESAATREATYQKLLAKARDNFAKAESLPVI